MVEKLRKRGYLIKSVERSLFISGFCIEFILAVNTFAVTTATVADAVTLAIFF